MCANRYREMSQLCQQEGPGIGPGATVQRISPPGPRKRCGRQNDAGVSFEYSKPLNTEVTKTEGKLTLLAMFEQLSMSTKLVGADEVENEPEQMNISPATENRQRKVTWKDIIVSLPCRSSEKGNVLEMQGVGSSNHRLLHEVSGCAEPGQLLAIMGSSGAGKTTLLNVISGRSSGQLTVNGLITVNGRPINDSIKKQLAFVQQFDLFLETLTVREQLMFKANLRLKRETSKEEKIQRVDQIICDMGLSECAGSFVGLPGHVNAISGSELKRLSFAYEMLCDPPIILCDEPTTGMDSSMAEEVVKALKRLAERGHTVITTIHQPSSNITALFDRIYLLSEGKCVYTGTVESAVRFFKSVGYVCPDQYCPTDFFLHTLAIKPGMEEECLKRVQDFQLAYLNSREFLTIEAECNNIKDDKTLCGADEIEIGNVDSASWGNQLQVLSKRNLLNTYRQPGSIYVKIVSDVVVSILTGTLYLRTDLKQSSVQNWQGALYFVTLYMGALIYYDALRKFPAINLLFGKEYDDGTYCLSAFFISKVLTDLLMSLISCFVIWTIAFVVIGFGSPLVYFSALGVFMLMTVALQFSGMCLGAPFSSITGYELRLLDTWLIASYIMGGFFLKVGTLPPFLLWIYYLSIYPFAFECISIIVWKDVDYIACDIEDTQRCFHNGQQVLLGYGFNVDNVPMDIAILVATAAGGFVLCYLVLYIKANSTRIRHRLLQKFEK